LLLYISVLYDVISSNPHRFVLYAVTSELFFLLWLMMIILLKVYSLLFYIPSSWISFLSFFFLIFFFFFFLFLLSLSYSYCFPYSYYLSLLLLLLLLLILTDYFFFSCFFFYFKIFIKALKPNTYFH